MTDHPLLEWLRSPGCRALLEECATSFPSWKKNLVTLPGSQGKGSREEESPSQAELVTAIWDLLRSLRQETSLDLLALLHAGDLSRVKKFILDKCFSKAKDATRDPFYRHLREVLSNTPGIFYQASAKGAWYAWVDKHAMPPAPQELLAGLSYASWPQPVPTSPEGAAKTDEDPTQGLAVGEATLCNNLHKLKGIRAAAKFYWIEICDVLDGEYAIPVRELSRYLRTVCAVAAREISEADLLVGEEETPILEDYAAVFSAQSATPLEYMHASAEAEASQVEDAWEMTALAFGFLRLLNAQKRRLYALLHNDSLTLQVIANSLGYKRPSNVAYHKKLIDEQLTQYMAHRLRGRQESYSRLASRLAQLCGNGEAEDIHALEFAVSLTDRELLLYHLLGRHGFDKELLTYRLGAAVTEELAALEDKLLAFVEDLAREQAVDPGVLVERLAFLCTFGFQGRNEE